MLIVITGPMFSGKTSKLFEILDEYHAAGRTSALFKPKNDSRYDNFMVSTHDRRMRHSYPIPKDEPEKLFTLAATLALLTPRDDFIPASVFGIDEPQFFEPKGLIEGIEDLLYGSKLPQTPVIVVSGLSQDFQGKPFGAMPHLLAIADEIIHCKAVCSEKKTRQSATRTHRKSKTDAGQIVVGGAELYEPRSFESWLRERK